MVDLIKSKSIVILYLTIDTRSLASAQGPHLEAQNGHAHSFTSMDESPDNLVFSVSATVVSGISW